MNDLLTFSRRSAPHRSALDVNALVERTAALLAHRMEMGEIELSVDLARDLPLVWCDGSQVQQVVVNLFMNAAEATDRGGRVTLRTRWSEERDAIVITVSDTGCGIPPEHIERVFEPFFSTKPDGHGVGLGLSVVHGIVDAHGGEISVRSRPGAGSTLTVLLPREGPGEGTPAEE